MKIHLELNCETLSEVRAELTNFLASETAAAAPAATNITTPATATAVATAPTGTAQADTITRPAPTPVRGRRTRSAADVALGLEVDDDTGEGEENEDGKVAKNSRQPDAEQLLADKAQLNFDFDRVLALQGRAAALGIVRGVLPSGTKTKLKDIEALPVALIPAAIAALQAAGAN